MRRSLVLLVLAVVLMSAQVVTAELYSFYIFTDNGYYYDDSGIELLVDVTNGDGQVDFTFYNESELACTIASIYFDDGSLLGISGVIDGPGTNFDTPAKSIDLPAGNLLDPDFDTTEAFSAVGQQPPPFNGVNNSMDEWVTITFDLLEGGTLQDVLDELDTGILRIGLHITSFPDGSSESAVNYPYPVPEPATVGLLALGGLVLLRVRKS